MDKVKSLATKSDQSDKRANRTLFKRRNWQCVWSISMSQTLTIIPYGSVFRQSVTRVANAFYIIQFWFIVMFYLPLVCYLHDGTA